MKKLIVMLVFYSFALPAWATEVKLENIQVDTSVSAVERGADTSMNYCHSCHSLKYIRYRDLATFGIDKKKIEAWRGDQSLDAPLASLMSDAAAMQSFGKIPPDLSLMTNAREDGASYVYSYLLGYYNTPEGMTSNHIFPETKMPDVLGISGTTELAQRDELQGKAHDIVSFLAWAADPHEGERHRLGYYVIGYLVILTSLLYIVKKQIWLGLK
jgi:ubiquinol-cytochrome c reductase cytochrome c1 subunit